MNTDFALPYVEIRSAEEYFINENDYVTFFADIIAEKDVFVMVFTGGAETICYNCRGKNYLGEYFEKYVKLEKGKPKRFWFTAKKAGECVISLTDEDGNKLAEKIVTIKPSGKAVYDPFADSKNLNRLLWLNSDKGIDHSVTKPFDKIFVCGDEISVTGRKIVLKNGFPSIIRSYFTESVKISDNFTDILAGPVEFKVGEEIFVFKNEEETVFDDCVIKKCEGISDNFRILTVTKVEFDGFIEIKNTLKCLKTSEIRDISLEIPFNEEKTRFFTGLGKKGGCFDGKLDWKWVENKNQDGFWCGNTDGGLKVKLKGGNYRKPFVNIYYSRRKLNKPESWDNCGKGGIRFKNGSFIAYSGKRIAQKGEKLEFDVELLVTPLKEINLKNQLKTRIFHKMFDSDKWLSAAEKGGANVINVHHGNDLNPYINYPFAELDELKIFVENAHEKGIGVKPYYTMRELSVYSPEFEAFRDMDGELIAKNEHNAETNFWQKEAAEWIEKNIGDDVTCAWRQPLKGEKYKDEYDASVLTEGQSRLCNFYVEGLDYLVKNADIDGIYIDDTAYDRTTMKRVRKILDKKESSLIDFHQWNHVLAAEGNTATMYMELYPYVDRCWIGEGFDYDESPDYWLTEVSGIPYGVMSEMMDAGNKYRGLLFGITSRLGWETNPESPSEIWKAFDKFGLCDAEFIGWWDKKNPISTGLDDALASGYFVGDEIYIAVANFSKEERTVDLRVMGYKNASFFAPEINDFQSEETFGRKIVLSGGKGKFLRLIKNSGR